ncbi:N-acetylmuramoyl-L-alanine amidase [Pseudonocardia sp. GCM10023141]|uniref:N-acetylmuramoyl-L-alanine amidase n=1 Tax=Pseudonocardia sp. GCM10023141 TaxID=3252653 RepID=UPI00360DE4D6
MTRRSAMAGAPATEGFPTPGDQVVDVAYLSRAGWGADESLRCGPDGAEHYPEAYFPVQALTVHHTVTANDDPDPAATMRAIYAFHTLTQDFGDVGYHLLIDRFGTVHEGRWSGADGIPVFGGPAGPVPRMGNAAHVGGFNAGNIGIAFLGDLTATAPTPAARQAMVTVLAALARATGIDPLAQVTYVNPLSGATAQVPAISGHRDRLPTQCPGDACYSILPALRADVAALVHR